MSFWLSKVVVSVLARSMRTVWIEVAIAVIVVENQIKYVLKESGGLGRLTVRCENWNLCSWVD